MTHRLKNVEYSCRIIDKTRAMCSTIRQLTDDEELLDLSWDIESNLEDIRTINDQLRTLGNEYIVMIDDLNKEVDGCYSDIRYLEDELNEIKQSTIAPA